MKALKAIAQVLLVLGVFQMVSVTLSGQFEEESRLQTIPDGVLDGIVDRFGKALELEDVYLDELKYLPLAAFTECTEENLGYFNVLLEPGCGMDLDNSIHMERREVLCQVLTDLSDFISQQQHNAELPTVNISIRDIEEVFNGGNYDGVVGQASTYFYLPCCNPDAGGLIEGVAWKTINTGYDGWTNVLSPLAGYVPSHGYLTLNYSLDIDFHLGLETATPAGEIDLYSVILHEMMHMLDFGTLFDVDGSSTFGNFGQYYTRFDSFLQDQSGTNFLSPVDGGCAVYNQTISGLTQSAISPGANCPEFVDLSQYINDVSACTECQTPNCVQQVQYGGTANIGVLTPNCFIPGTSLGHLDGCNNGESSFLMTSLIGGDWEQRFPQMEERAILADLGYLVGTTYGTDPNVVQHIYSGAPSSGIQTTGVNDGVNDDNSYTYTAEIGGSVSICIHDGPDGILFNDRNATGAGCFEIVIGGGSLSVDNSDPDCDNAQRLIYVPNGFGGYGVHLLRYIPTGPDGDGNITYIYVNVPNPLCAEECNMVPDGGFESLGSEVWCEANLSNTTLTCWRKFSESPDLLGRDCSPGTLSIPNSCQGIQVENWQNDPLNDNDHVIRLRSENSAPLVESIQTTLNAPFVPGVTYTLGAQVYFCSPIDLGVEGEISIYGAPSLVGSPINGTFASHLASAENTLVLLATINLEFGTSWEYVQTSFVCPGEDILGQLFLVNSTPFSGQIDTFPLVMIDDVFATTELLTCSLSLPEVLCIDSEIIDLQAYTDCPEGQFYLSTDLENPITTFEPTIEGIYTIVYEYPSNLNSNCLITISQTIEVLDFQAGQLTIDAVDVLGCAEDAFYLSADITDGTESFVYNWSPSEIISPTNTADVTASPVESTTILLEVTDGNGCWTSASIDIEIEQISIISDPESATVCDGAPITLTAIGGDNVTWTDENDIVLANANSFVVNPSVESVYYATATTPGGCVDVAEITVYIGSAPNMIVTIGDDSFCEGGSTQISVEGVSTLQWPVDSSLDILADFLADANPSVTTDYELIGESDGCTVAETITITVTPTPIVTFTDDLVNGGICPGYGANIEAAINGVSAGNVLWLIDGAYESLPYNQYVSPTVSTLYQVSIFVNGCQGSGSILVNVHELTDITLDSNPDSPICLGNDVTVTATGVDDWIWTTPPALAGTIGNTVDFTIVDEGFTIFTVDGTDENGCVNTEFIAITGENCCDLVLSGFIIEETCIGSSDGSIEMTLTGTFDAENLQIEWSGDALPVGNDVSSLIQMDLPFGEYTITITDLSTGFDCSVEQTIELVAPLEYCCDLEIDAIVLNETCPSSENGSVSVELNGTYEESNIEYLWTDLPDGFNSTNPDQNDLPTGIYTLDVLDVFTGCVASQTFEITTEFEFDYPNGLVIDDPDDIPALSGQTLYFGGPLTINLGTGQVISYNFATFVFAENQTIKVHEESGIHFRNSTLTSCAQSWQGVRVISSGNSDDAPGRFSMSESDIENAVIGIATDDTNAPDTHKAGFIWIGDSRFTNCKQSLKIENGISMGLGNPDDLDDEVDPHYAFFRTDFVIDDDFSNHFPIEDFSEMVFGNNTRGYGFQDCNFYNNISVSEDWNMRGKAINLFNARMDVRSTEDNVSEIRGFEYGIDTYVDLNTWNFQIVREVDFEQNRVAIHTNGLCFHQLIGNNIQVGGPLDFTILLDDMPWREGIFMQHSAFYRVTENQIDGVDGDDYSTFGIRLLDTNSPDDEIYKNYLNNLNFANLAMGINADPNGLNGVRYICNQNSNNDNDFIISDDPFPLPDGEPDDEARIANLQEDPATEILSFSAGNSFTISVSGIEGNFRNDGTYEDYIYHYNSGSPTEYSQTSVDLFFDSDQNNCYDVVEIIQEDGEIDQTVMADLVQAANNSHDSWVANKYLHLSLIDDGDTEDLQNLVEDAWSEDIWQMREAMLARSPNLSISVLYSIADKTNVFPHEIALEIFLANPDALRDRRFFSYLENKADPMPSYMVNIIRSGADTETTRTLIEAQISLYRTLHLSAIRDIMSTLGNDVISNQHGISNYLKSIESLQTEYLIVEQELIDGNIVQAQNRLDSIPKRVYLSNVSRRDYNQFKNWIDIRIEMHENNLTWDSLPSNLWSDLDLLLDEYRTTAGSNAIAVMNAWNDQNYYIPPAIAGNWEVRNFHFQEHFESSSKLSCSAYPVPADNLVHFEIDGTWSGTGLIVLYDVQGRIIRTVQIDDNVPVIDMYVSDLAIGIYQYKAYFNKIPELHGKIEIIH